MERIDNLLLNCIENGDIPGVKQACESGANANLRVDGIPILHIVAIRGLPAMVNALIASGADVDARDESRLTALMYVAFLASGEPHDRVLDGLIEAGADIHAKHELSGRTAIDMAAQFLNADSVRLLSVAGATPTTILSKQWAREALARTSGRDGR
jgi:ankyrin repeat protein